MPPATLHDPQPCRPAASKPTRTARLRQNPLGSPQKVLDGDLDAFIEASL
jgi:hypothetical protein